VYNAFVDEIPVACGSENVIPVYDKLSRFQIINDHGIGKMLAFTAPVM
jgi:hypothetical protein